MFPRRVLICLLAALVAPQFAAAAAPIDRHALVTRHNPTITAVDKSAPFMVGNGESGVHRRHHRPADLSGAVFAARAADDAGAVGLAQLSESERLHARAGAEVPIKVRGKKQKYPYLSNWDAGEETRRSSGCARTRIAFRWGASACVSRTPTASRRRSAISPRRARRSTCGPAGSRAASCSTATPVEVETSVHPKRDLIIVRLRSQLLSDGRLGVDLKFPGVSAKLNPDPADWAHPESHTTHGDVAQRRRTHARAPARRHALLGARARRIASSTLPTPAAHAYRLTAPGSTQITLLVEFAESAPPAPLPDAEARARSGRAVVGKLLDARRRGGFHRQQRSARQGTRAPHRAVAVPHRGQQRRQRAAAGRGAVLQ